MAGAYEVMRFLEIVLAGLQVATLHDHEFFQDAERPTKKMSGLLERLPTAHLLPIVARTENSALPFKRQLWTKYLIPRGRERPTTDRAAWTYCRARLNRASLA